MIINYPAVLRKICGIEGITFICDICEICVKKRRDTLIAISEEYKDNSGFSSI
jgi:hypothetical protein